MRRSMAAGLVVCLVVASAAHPALAQEQTEEGTQGQRVEVPEAGLSMAFPSDWSVVTQMIRDDAQLPPESGEDATTDVWVVLEAADKAGGGCDLGMYLAHPLSFEEHVEWVGRSQAEASETVASVESNAVELPFGPAERFDVEFTEGGVGAAYLFESEEARYQLRCVGLERPTDDWLAIAGTVEFMPLVPMDLPAPGASGLGEGVDIVLDFPTTVSVVDPGAPDFPVASLMNADCAFALRVEAEDGSATEWIACTLNDEPVEPSEYQGVRPTETVTDSGAECVWRSDYWYETDRTQVPASEFEITVTPRGRVYARSGYPAEPLECPGM